MFENKVLSRILEAEGRNYSKLEKVNNVEIHALYSSPNIPEMRT